MDDPRDRSCPGRARRDRARRPSPRAAGASRAWRSLRSPTSTSRASSGPPRSLLVYARRRPSTTCSPTRRSTPSCSRRRPGSRPGSRAGSLEAGKYVLAEKPLAPSLAEAAELAELPAAHERLQIGLTYRHHPSSSGCGSSCANGRARRSAARSGVGVRRGRRSRRRPGRLRTAAPVARALPARDLRRRARLRPAQLPPRRGTDHRPGWALRSDERYATANANGAILEYDDGTLARLDVIWLYPVLPPSQFVVTGPRGCAVLDPPTFALSVGSPTARRRSCAAPGDKTEVCFAAPAQPLRRPLPRGDAARPRARRGARRASSSRSASRRPQA